MPSLSSDKTLLLIGASRGLGFALAEEYLKRGWNVVATERSGTTSQLHTLLEASDGRLEIGGELPVNTAGGLLSETGMPGLQLVLEGVRQMRGEANLQVEGAKTCIVSNQGGIMHTHSTLIMGNHL